MDQTTTQSVLFCHGCNEKFAVPVDSQMCPQCGLTLAVPADASTMDFDDLAARGTYMAGADGPVEAADSLVGRQLGLYDINAFLGKGGMARVYRAKHLMLERPCAIKVLNPQLVERSPEYIDMFLSEARSAASLVHPNVVTIHTIGHDEGLHYIEMEYVIGRSLQRFIESSGEPDATQSTSFMVQITSALAEAHRMGMIHRDLKPANVLVTSSAVAKLADFGLAKRVIAGNRSAGSRSLSGTPHYMAPELFDGHPADKRSDVYAMGVTYFYLLTGRLPFVDQSFTDLAIRHATDPVPDIRAIRDDIPDDATSVVFTSMAKDPKDRYADAAELLGEVKAVYGGLRSLESLLTEALANTSIQVQESGDRFVTQIHLSGGRSQTVFIESCAADDIAERIVKIYSVCGPSNELFYRRALELNAVIPHGSIAIEPIDGQPHFVIGNTYPRATCDPEEIRRSVLTIAQHADAVERLLTSRDVH
jgi:serine/threonine-protein kinase